MKKLLKCALSLATIATLGVSSAFAETTPNYVIEVKSKKYSKQTTSGLYGLVYTEAYDGYGDSNWPLVECYTPFVETNDAFYATDENGTYKKHLIRQFGVSKGVVYWINPTQNVIHYWNTFTGETGTDTPEKGVRGSATPSKHKGLNYASTDIPGQSNFAYPFSGTQTGMGSVTHDWHGNIVHQWNNVSGAGINTPVQGYAVYKSPTEFGQLIDFEPRLSDMTTQTMPYLRRTIVDDGDGVNDSGDKMKGNSSSDHTQSNYYNTTAPNPDWVGNQISWINNWYYHAWNSAYSGSTKQVVDFMGASGNLYGNDGLVESDYFWGYWGGQIFHTYNGITFGHMFADGQYSNWFLNYDLYVNAKPTNVQMTETDYKIYNSAGVHTSTVTKYKPGEYSLSTYPREYMFRECDVLDYFWTLPVSGYYEVTTKGGYRWTFDYRYLESTDGTTNRTANLSMYTSTHPRYGFTMSGGYDAMNIPEVDSIKGHRVLIHNMWLQYWPENTAVTKNGTVYNMRDGQIQIRACAYDGGYNATTKKWPGDPTNKYEQVGYGYGYNKQTNDYINNTNTTDFKTTNTSVNCWNELERVNDNVFALYTNVPGKGFSKYYITAVEQDNPVTLVGDGVTQKMDANNNIVNILSWTPQEHDRGTMHRYQIYYRTKKVGATVYEKTEVVDGTTRYPWQLAGVTEYKGTYAGQTLTFNHIAPYGTDASGNYDRVYEYMIMPIYDASSHYGTETILAVTPTSLAPVCPVEGTLHQVTGQNSNGETLYGFSVQLDPTLDATATGATSATKMVIVPADDATATELAKATSVTTTSGSATISTASETFKAYDDVTITGYHINVEGFTVGSDGKLPSITWHNIDPDKEYKVKVYVVATASSYFTPSDVMSTTLVVPEPKWSLTVADFHKLGGDYGTLTGNEDQPIGSFRRINPNTKDLELSNPVTLNNANYYGTNGSTLKPLYVTEEVLGTLSDAGKRENNGWYVSYSMKIYDGETEVYGGGSFGNQTYSADHAKLYSNETDAICDIIGMNVPYTVSKAADGRDRNTYTPVQKTYKAVITVTYTRTDNSDIKVTRSSESDLVVGTTTLANLGVNADNPGILYYNSSTHWDENYPGYYPHYYNALMQFGWGENNILNRYMGYFATSKFECLGHYTADSPDLWVKYFAGSVMSDASVAEYNSVQSGVLSGIGYDGTNNTNWSALAINSNQVPMMIHYVYGGEEKLTADDYVNATFDVEFTAEYPLVVASETGFGIIRAVEDPANYIIDDDTRSMYVLTVPQTLSNIHATSFVTTGVEGIVTDACGGVQMYPNPVVNDFTLRAPMALNEVRIFTMDGQLVKVVKDITDTTATINVAELPQGMYLVNTLGMSQIMIKK